MIEHIIIPKKKEHVWTKYGDNPAEAYQPYFLRLRIFRAYIEKRNLTFLEKRNLTFFDNPENIIHRKKQTKCKHKK